MRRRLAGAALVLALAVILALQAYPAQAKLVYPLIGQLTGAGTPSGSFSSEVGGLHGLAIDGKTHQTLVGDSEHHLVDLFDSSGAFACQITGAGSAATDPTHECDSADPGAPGGAFGNEIISLAANDSSGDIYVDDYRKDVIDVFSSAGKYLCQITGLGEASTSASECDKTDPGTPDGSFRELNAVAVDQATGDVYVADGREFPAGNHIDVFSPAGKYLWQLTSASLPGGRIGEVNSMAIDDHTGQLLVPAAGSVNVFDIATHAYVEAWTGADTPNGNFGFFRFIAADNASGDVYLSSYQSSSEQALYALDPAGHYRYQITGTPAAFGRILSGGLAVDQASGNQYVGDAEKKVVDIFSGTPVTVPDVATTSRSATAIGQTTATLSGTVNPAGVAVTECRFEYVKAALYKPSAENPYEKGKSEPCAQSPAEIGAGSGEVPVSAQIGGLTQSTVYHYRLLAANANGAEVSADEKFVTAGPGFGIASFEAGSYKGDGTGLFDTGATPETQAGAHPFAQSTDFNFNMTIDTSGNLFPDGSVKDVETNLPPGLIGNPDAVPPCDVIVFYCPDTSQVGVIELREIQSGTHFQRYSPVYDMAPPHGMPAQLAFEVLGVPVKINISLRAGADYGVTARLRGLPQSIGVTGNRLTLWGVPADESHSPYRGSVSTGGCLDFTTGSTGICPSGEPLRPFLSLPTACGGPQAMALEADSWQEPGRLARASAGLEATTGCAALGFSPTLKAAPSTDVADSPSGLGVDLKLPQHEGCTEEGGEVVCENGEAELKNAKVTLPEGLVVNPAEANGLDACSSAQIGFKPGTSKPFEFTPGPAECPPASRIGTVKVETPLLEHPLPGSVYLAKPYDNPFNSILAIYIAIYDPISGVVVKLPGRVEADPATGRLTTRFDENPQLPFEHLKLHLFEGAAAPLMTPPTCGSYATASALTSWAGQSASPGDKYLIDRSPGGGGCATSAAQMPNSPSFSAGTVTPIAASYSPFVLTLKREDGSQRLSVIETTLPEGLLGKLLGVAYCPQAAIDAAGHKSGREEQASPSCPADSELGSVVVGAGAGPAPYYARGKVYLAGPYQGAPLSLVVLTPAVAGPFDLGDVVTRVSLQVNPETAQITAKSDPLPSVLVAGGDGFPLDIRSIAMKIDRPSFTLNPTSCNPMAIGGSALSTLGQAAALSARFQVSECQRLGFKPRLSLSLKGSTKRTGHPALRAVLTMKPGQANIARAQVTLPHSEFLDQGHIGTVCTRVQFAEGNVPGEKCPAASVYGFAKAVTPLLEKPVEGPVYLRSNPAHKLPDLVAALNGQINVALAGRIDTGRNGGIRNTFEVVPDAPVSKFTLTMEGGRKGLLENSESLCGRKPHRAIADFTAQNGKLSDTEPVVKAKCPKVRRGHGHHRRRH